MKVLWKTIASILFYVVAGALMIYAATRSLHFVQSTLSGGNEILGYLALAATSIGAVVWLLVFLHTAHGTGQKAIAGIMTVIDLLGEFALFTIDTLMTSSESGMIQALAPEEIQGVIVGMSILIALNIAATVAFHLVEPENMKNMREEAVRDHLESESLKIIEKKGEEIARDLAPKMAEEWAREFEARFNNIQSLGLGKSVQPEHKQLPGPSGLTFPCQTQHKRDDILEPELEHADVEHSAPVGFSNNGHSPNGHNGHVPANPTK